MPSTTTNDRSLFGRGLRVLATYVRTHPLPFTVAVIGAAFYALATVASTVVLGRVTDHLLIPAFAGHFRLATAVGALPGGGGRCSGGSRLGDAAPR